MDMHVFGPDLALGIPALDQGHKVIFDLLIGLESLPRPQFDDACRELVAELSEDIQNEEELMASIAYPNAEVHCAAHARLLECLDHAMVLLARGDEASARRAIHFLPEWIEAHINTMDLALAVALSKRR